MRRKIKEKFKDITKEILKLLGVGAGVSLLAMLGGGRQGTKLMKSLGKYGVWQVRQTLKQLRLRGYIEYDDDDERALIRLTDGGMRRVAHFRVADIVSGCVKKWDYLWRMVIFDIPEKKRRSRDAFRHELKALGFFLLQDSVFVIPHKCEKEIIELARTYGVLSDILILTVASLGPKEKEVRKYFLKKSEE
ncbi:MAG: CRISPR-associated endonuclease Cas2 [Patescibacteria group bacterium]